MLNKTILTQSKRQNGFSIYSRNHSSRGFILIELLATLAICAFVILPMSAFLISHSDIDAFIHKTTNKDNTVDILRKVSPYGGGQIYPTKSVGYINLQPGRKSCDLFFQKLSTKNNDQISVQKNEIDLINHSRNLPTTIDVRSYIDTNDLYIGTNSASTTDPDMYIFTQNLHRPPQQAYLDNAQNISTSSFQKNQELFLGPGVIDAAVFKDTLFAIERSYTSPIWILKTDPTSRFSEKNIGRILVASSTINHSLPKVVKTDGKNLYIGAEKNVGDELYSLDLGTFTPNIYNQLGTPNILGDIHVSSTEISAGVSDIDFNFTHLFTVSAKDPEVEIWDRGISSGVTSFDAEGSSGNGKSLAVFYKSLLLGRTLGNSELIGVQINNNASPTSSSAYVNTDINQQYSANPNKSITKIMAVLGGKYIIAMTNNIASSLIIYKKTVNDISGGAGQKSVGESLSSNILFGKKNIQDITFSLAPILTIETKNILSDFDCTPDALYGVEEGTTTSMLYLTST